MTGQQLEQCFGSGFSPVRAITGFNNPALNRPSAAVSAPMADVSEQQHVVDATFTGGTLTIAPSATGDGLWVPYLGNGTGVVGAKGWGTYTQDVTSHSWVATGPFSGCFVAAFAGGAGKRFAHLITPAGGYTAATVDEQIAAITAATGAGSFEKWPMNGVGLGIAFFMKIGGGWCRRFAWVAPGAGMVMQMNAKSTPIS